MNSFIPREKLGKRARKAQDQRKRILWDNVNPVTRKTENKKRYNRKRSPRWYNDDSTGIFYFHCIPCIPRKDDTPACVISFIRQKDEVSRFSGSCWNDSLHALGRIDCLRFLRGFLVQCTNGWQGHQHERNRHDEKTGDEKPVMHADDFGKHA